MTSSTRYEEMLEKYREIDEDAILSSLTEKELQQLEVRQRQCKSLFKFFNAYLR